MKRATVAACIGLCLGSAQLELSPIPAHAQSPIMAPRDNVAPPAVGTARISGRIIAADTGNPIARAQVQISSPALPKERQAMTDARP